MAILYLLRNKKISLFEISYSGRISNFSMCKTVKDVLDTFKYSSKLKHDDETLKIKSVLRVDELVESFIERKSIDSLENVIDLINHVVNMARTSVMSVEIQLSVVNIFTSLLTVKTCDIIALFGNCGVCELSVVVTRAHIKNEHLVQSHINLIFELCTDNKSNKARIGNSEFCDYVADLTNKYKTKSKCFTSVLKLITVLCNESPVNQDRLGSSGLPDALVFCLSFHSNDSKSLHIITTVSKLCSQRHNYNQELFTLPKHCTVYSNILKKSFSDKKPFSVKLFSRVILMVMGICGNRIDLKYNFIETEILDILFQVILFCVDNVESEFLQPCLDLLFYFSVSNAFKIKFETDMRFIEPIKAIISRSNKNSVTASAACFIQSLGISV